MHVTAVRVYHVAIPLKRPMIYPHRTYTELSDTIVCLETETGALGWGEVCPLSSTYQAETAEGVRAAIAHLALVVLGCDPTQIDVVNDKMNAAMLGERYAKSVFDIACWDLAGKAYGRPTYHLLGGRRQTRAKGYVDIYVGEDDSTIPVEMDEYRRAGFSHFQLKVGKGTSVERDIDRIRIADSERRPGEVLVVDANKHWQTHEALRVLRATEAVDFYVEQPCSTYEECLSIRQQVRQPMLLDESMTDLPLLLRGLADNCFEGIGCKITRVGGISAMRQIRDVCHAAHKIMTVDDAWGSDLSAAAQAHLSASTHPSTFFGTYISTYFSSLRYDTDSPIIQDGFIAPSDKPGLGVDPDPITIGEPIVIVG